LVLGWTVVLDVGAISNEPEGDPGDGPDADVIASVPVDDEAVPITLTRSRAPDGTTSWLVSRATVAMIPTMYAAHGARWIGDKMPPFLSRYRLFDLALWQWIGIVLAALLACGIGLLGGSVLLAIGERIAKRTAVTWDDDLVLAARGPSRLALGMIAFKELTEILQVPVTPRLIIERIWGTLLVVSAAWFLIRLIRVGATTLEGALPAEDTVGELRVRGLRTRVSVLRRIASILVGVLAVAAVLMQFDIVRSFGMSLLASAGIVGVLVGFAAQKSLSGMVAGIHLSITQPVRIDDTVMIEGQLGTIEEINLTYVVVRLWDQRRLIVPISRFLEQTFENWTTT
jgi:small-conductance mechanosensitive channel